MAQTLQHGAARVVQAVLVAKGWGTDPLASPLGGWPVYARTEPDRPDSLIVVTGTGGGPGPRLMTTGEARNNPGFAVLVRSSDDDAGERKADEIFTGLTTDLYMFRVTVDGTDYLVQCVVSVGAVVPAGSPPGSRRRLFTLGGDLVARQL